MADTASRYGRTAVLLESRGAVWIEVPKVACSSIRIALAGMLGVDLGPGGNPHEAAFPEPPPADPTGERFYPGLFSFAFVRNPWGRLVSCWRDKIMGESPDFTSFHPERGVAYCLARFDAFRPGMPFEAFVEAVAAIPDEEADEHFRSQHTFLAGADGEVAVDFVGRFESLQADFVRVAERIGLPVVTLPHVQAVRGPMPYADFYTSRTRERVAERFDVDVRLFGYTFVER